jgi:hypothetical protein
MRPASWAWTPFDSRIRPCWDLSFGAGGCSKVQAVRLSPRVNASRWDRALAHENKVKTTKSRKDFWY